MTDWKSKAETTLALLETGQSQPVSPILEALSSHELEDVMTWVHDELAATPQPIGPWHGSAIGRRRFGLERLRDAVLGARGDAEARMNTAARDWMLGRASAVPYIRLQLERGERTQARISASMALEDRDCADRDLTQQLLDEAAGVPPGMLRALDSFAIEPSREGWESNFRFTPAESDYDWLQYVMRALMRRNIDGDRLFELASENITSSLLDLLDSGRVDPAVVEQRAWRCADTPGLWLSLAARAAFARGAEEKTIELLKEGRTSEKLEGFTLLQLLHIREHASEQLNARLTREGLPTVEEVLSDQPFPGHS